MARQPAHQTKPNPEKNPRRDPTAAGQRDAAVNRIASHNYFLLEKFEAGGAPNCMEGKKGRAGRAKPKEFLGVFKDGQPLLVNNQQGTLQHSKNVYTPPWPLRR